jgi:hypothetical protein
MKGMNFRVLGALPPVWVAVFLLGLALLPSAFTTGYIRAEIEAAKLLTFVGSLLAARAFSPGDYLRRAWSLIAACYALLLVRDGIYLGLVEGSYVFGVRYEYVQAVIAMSANSVGLVGSLMLARAWHVAGIELPGRPAARVAAMALLVVVSAGIAGPATLVEARNVVQGNLQSLVGLSSDVGDLLSMCFVAPVFFTALAMRGGRLRWPWAFMTASLLFWLFYDACPLLIGPLGLAPLPGRVLRESFRGLACLYGFSAGVAQALALREPTFAPPDESQAGETAA